MTVEGVARALEQTLLIWLVSLGIAAILAIFIAYLRMSKRRVFRWFAVAYIRIARGIPPLSWMFLIYFGISIGGMTPSVAAIIALGFVFAAYMAEVYRSSIESVSGGVLEAATALGLSQTQAMFRVVIPTSVRLMIGNASSIVISVLKESSLASLIGVVELTNYAASTVQMSGNGMFVYFIVGCVYLVLSSIVGVAARFGSKPVKATV
ncbi:amino acid ABC transporter permease [Paeniglutamicibacter cryotolerans]|uniref:Polar amino acid transport system permease protein/cystine transport system permease protein n=1 Tax=Paeniglutamicibacter cryotolerans TaxID=670079 RepID=A0A839QU84_9MICC|nr:ABC transporter permease subunit [Paeniglutamicibacter cryotolerans]MBB2997526.1 polar amino acid transport system permease protein/cystine transport system permease protein [Paeniglutamicibacter cryotolerans]